jgi:hypothetical protein
VATANAQPPTIVRRIAFFLRVVDRIEPLPGTRELREYHRPATNIRADRKCGVNASDEIEREAYDFHDMIGVRSVKLGRIYVNCSDVSNSYCVFDFPQYRPDSVEPVRRRLTWLRRLDQWPWLIGRLIPDLDRRRAPRSCRDRTASSGARHTECRAGV